MVEGEEGEQEDLKLLPLVVSGLGSSSITNSHSSSHSNTSSNNNSSTASNCSNNLHLQTLLTNKGSSSINNSLLTIHSHLIWI